jgi:DNA processing protein
LVDILKVQGDRSIDELSYVFQLTPSEMASLLLNLEFKGVIKSLPGKRFCML